MKLKNSKIGYTILELMLVITIALILATSITMGLRNFMIEKSIEKEVVNFWKELCAIRSKVLKSDSCYFVTFDEANNTYQVWKDADDLLDCEQDDDDVTVPSAFLAKIEYGLPDNLDGIGPDGTTKPEAPIEWGSGIMKVENDDIGTISVGRVCISSSRMPKLGYCIQVRAGTQNIKLFKWTGSSWYEM